MHSNSVSIIQCFGLEVDACMIEFIIIACSFVSLQQIQCGFYASDPGCSLRDGSTAACMERGEVYCMMRSAVNSLVPLRKTSGENLMFAESDFIGCLDLCWELVSLVKPVWPHYLWLSPD